jgi:hypothetical protein
LNGEDDDGIKMGGVVHKSQEVGAGQKMFTIVANEAGYRVPLRIYRRLGCVAYKPSIRGPGAVALFEVEFSSAGVIDMPAWSRPGTLDRVCIVYDQILQGQLCL